MSDPRGMNGENPGPAGSAVPTADTLVDAHCLHCGYLLRGLPENRCPECGTPFDPATYTGAFSPRWPSLMVWFLAAYLVALLTGAASHLHWILSRPAGGIPTGVAPVRVTYGINLRSCLEVVLAPAFAVMAILGLRRRLDWGRKVCIALQIVQPAAWLTVFWLVQSGHSRATLGGKNWQTDWSLPDLLFDAGACPVIIICLLITGLRSRSLSRDADSLEVRLPLARYQPQHDWPLVMSVLLATVALEHLHDLVDSIVFVFRHVRWTDLTRNSVFIGYMAVNLITAVCYAIVAVRVWRHPARAPSALVVAAVILAAAVILDLTVQVISSRSLAFLSKPQMIQMMMNSIRYLVTAVLPICAMMMFLRREPSAVAQVGPSGSPIREQPAN